ncbi:MAG TPA: hypothetical protein VF832_08475 [Longimicrobiales bacterium]
MHAPARPGHSLLELSFVLLLLGVLLGAGLPPLRRAMAWAQARSARDAVALQAARARALAVARGGADLVLDLPHARAWIESSDTVLAPVVLGDERLLILSADGSPADTVRIGWDGLGVGRIASRTLRFRAGAAEARLTVSGYGRVRAW